MKRLVRAALVILVTATITACNNTPTSPSSITGGAGAPLNRQFLSPATESGRWNASERDLAGYLGSLHQALVLLSRWAQSAGDTEEVKFFALQMQQEHSGHLMYLLGASPDAAEQQLTSLTAEHQQLQTQLTGVTGSALDRMYMELVIQLHEAAIARVQGTSASSGLLGEHALNVTQRMRTHLLEARDIGRMVGAASAEDTRAHTNQ
jgi:predicted outer membrane protein